MQLSHIDWSYWPEPQALEMAFADPQGFARAFRAANLNHDQRNVFVDSRWLDLVELCERSARVGELLALTERRGGEFFDVIADSFWELNDRQAGRVAPKAPPAPSSDAFLLSFEWRRIRMVVLERDGGRCVCCGRTAADGVSIGIKRGKIT